MKKPYDQDNSLEKAREKLIGLGENSFRKNYYPELQKRLDQLERFRALLDHSNDAIFMVHLPDGLIYDVNESACHQLGYTKTDLLNNAFFLLLFPSNIPFWSRLFAEKTIEKKCFKLHKTLLKHSNGQGIPMELTLCLDVFVHQVYLVVIARDISWRQEAEERIKHLAYHDPLTDLPNRLLFKEHLKTELKIAEKNKKKLAVFFLDLDDFKLINDTLGHNAGDKILKQIGRRIVMQVNEIDNLARMGGDEFTLLLSEVNCLEDCTEVAEKIINTLKDPFQIKNIELHISASIGIALYPNDGKNVETLIKNADMAMYQAKEKGRNNFQFYDTSMNLNAVKKLALENSLRHALKKQEFVLFYQPKISLQTMKIVGMEALIRWQKPGRDLVPPAEFIPLAEDTGIIVPLGLWVLETTCKQIELWQEAGLAPLPIAINLSAVQFYQKDLVDNIKSILSQTHFDPSYLELEITESTAMRNANISIEMMYELKAMGLKISLDDFGTGYSSLSYLNRFPINTLKIDRSFVADISNGPNSRAIIRAALAMAQELNLTVVAEGVETKEQLRFLQELDCNEMQGFLFSQPVPTSIMENFLRRKTKLTDIIDL